MAFRWKVLFSAGCVVGLAMLYGLWYQFGPESAKPKYDAMRRYRLSTLSDADLKEIVEKASKAKAEYLARMQAAAKEADEREKQEREAREKIRAQCDSDPVFKLRNENLCHPHVGFNIPGPVPDEPTPSEDEFVEGYVMGRCLDVATVREARKIGCLAPQ